MDVGQLSSGTIRVLVGAGLILLGVVAMGSHSALLGLALFIKGENRFTLPSSPNRSAWSRKKRNGV